VYPYGRKKENRPHFHFGCVAVDKKITGM